MHGTKMRYLIYLLPILLVCVAGCAGPLRMEYAPSKPPETQVKGSGTIFIAPYEDARITENPQHMGTIASPVSNLHGDTRSSLTEMWPPLLPKPSRVS